MMSFADSSCMKAPLLPTVARQSGAVIRLCAITACLVGGALVTSMADAHVCFDARDSQPPAPSRFLDHGNGTVTDPVSGLTWKQCSEGRVYHPGSGDCTGEAGAFMAYPTPDLPETSGISFWLEGVNAGRLGENLGYADWRAPTLYELATLADPRCADPAIDTQAFPDTESGNYSGTTACPKYGQAGIDFASGDERCVFLQSFTFLRLVRGPADNQRHFSLSVSPGGRVSTSPTTVFWSMYGQNSCTSEWLNGCSGDYFPGTAIRMQAVPDTGYRFSGWSGDCEADSTTCAFSMGDADVEITAAFEPLDGPVAPGIHLADARYFFDIELPASGQDHPLIYQGWHGACAMTMLNLRVERGAVDIYLCPQTNDLCQRYPDPIDPSVPLFSYSLYTGDEQGLGLVSASPEDSRVTAFYYCFTRSEDDSEEQ